MQTKTTEAHVRQTSIEEYHQWDTPVHAHSHNAHHILYWQEKPLEQTEYPMSNLITLQRS